jgi:hypothetical protein
MKNFLRALALTGIVGLGAAAGAQAQTRVYVGIGAPVVAAIPPCPGDGYVWTAGYYDGAVWVPGRWMFHGYDRDRVVVRPFPHDIHPVYHFDHGFRGRR